jgi:hypothetical protein
VKIKVLIFLIVSIVLIIGGFFVWKNLIVQKIEVSKEETSRVEEKIPQEKKEQPKLKFEWKKDEGIRISDGGVPYVYKLKDGRFRLYYCGSGGILSAISTDGLNFEKEPGVRISSVNVKGDQESMVCDPTLVELPDGKIRMYYKGANGFGGPGEAIHKIFSALSSDGLNFQKEGLRIDSEKTGDMGWASVPEAIKLLDGKIRIYYVSGDPKAEGGIMSAISEDGLNFEKEKGARVKGNFVDPAITISPDGKFLLLVVYNCRPEKGYCNPNFPNGIYSLISDDGLNFSDLNLVIQFDPGSQFLDPNIVKIDENTFRVYFGVLTRPGEPMFIKSITGYLKRSKF